MSNNNISLQDVEIIAQGLRNNHSILGFHFIGNSGIIDAQGYLTPQIPQLLGGNSIMTRMQKDLKGGVINDSR